MSPDNLVALGIFGTAALALIAGLGAWIWEIVSSRKSPPPRDAGDVLGAAMPRPQPPKPVIPRKDIEPLPSPSLVSKPQAEPLPKTLIHPEQQNDETKIPSWVKTFPSLSTHKKKYETKISEPTPEAPRPVKKQAPLPEYGGMCSRCGENPKIPGNDGFCKECSPLD